MDYVSRGADEDLGTRGRPVKVAIVLGFLTTYRADLYRRLLSTPGYEITIFCHTPPASINLRSIHTQFRANVVLLKGWFFGQERVVISALPFPRLFRDYDVVFIEGNPRYVSHALMSTALALLKRRVVLWTMVHSYRGRKFGLWVRLAWYRVFSQLLVYTADEKRYLEDRGFKAKIVAIGNGIDLVAVDNARALWPKVSLKRWREDRALSGRRLILCCARLEAKNNFKAVLAALPRLLSADGSVLLCLIGDGPERRALEDFVSAHGLQQSVLFLGAIYSEHELAPWFLSAEFLVHPDAIGLTLLHAFAYGLPVVTHGDRRRHGPEFAAYVDRETGLAFTRGSVDSLSAAMGKMLGNSELREKCGSKAREVVVTGYTTQHMAAQFFRCIHS